MTKTEKKRANSLLLLIVFSVTLVLISFGILGQANIDSKGVRGTEGVFNLSSVSPDDNEQVYLQGDWEFYYNELLVTDGLTDKTPSEFLSVPGSWHSAILSKPSHPGGGYASYRGYLKNVNASDAITVYVPNLGEAYKVFIDGQLVSSSGTFDKKTNKVWSTTSADLYPTVLSSTETHEMIIEVAGDSFSGLYLSPLLINYTYNTYYTSAFSGLRYALIGIVIFCGILFTIIRALSRPPLYSIWLPILSFTLAFRMLISTEGYAISQYLFFFASYEKMNLFIFASTYIIKLVALMYLKDSLKFKVSDGTLVLFSVVFLSVAVGAGFLPSAIYDTYTFALLQGVSYILDLYTFNKLAYCIAKKLPNAETYMLSYCLISVGVMIDALYTNGIITFRCSSFMPICFFMFVVSVAVIHAHQIADIYKDAILKEHYQSELENANMSIMLSQIRPHFLYNALNTIKMLIRRDPQKAESAVIDFSYYLRGNMDSLSIKEPIPFSAELDHIKHYCDIELLRFSDIIDIEYEIETDSFLVPTLSIQPIVENAIKHGVTKKPEGGTVTLKAYEDEKYFYVKVIDDGVGFDISEPKEDDGRSHVGIDITKNRLKAMLNADMFIDSKKGVGTTVVVRLPKAENKKSKKEVEL